MPEQLDISEPLRILAVFGAVDDTNIPVENFLSLPADSFELHIVLCYQEEGQGESFLRQAFGGRSVRVHGIKRPNLAQFSSIYLVGALLNIIQKVSPDIVHVHHTRTAFAGALTARLQGVPVVLTIHSIWGNYSVWQRIFYNMAIFFSDLVVCNSETTASELSSVVSKYYSGRLRICHNGVQIQQRREIVRPEEYVWHTLSDCFVIGTAARLVSLKDIKTLIRGFALFREKTGDGILLIAGDGPEKEELQRLSCELGVNTRVCFLGKLKRNEVRDMLQYLDVYVVSSLYEGFCVGMVEAMAAALPVITTDVAPLPQISGCGSGGVFIPGDCTQLAERLLLMYQRPDIRCSIGSAARLRAEEQFSMQKCVDCYIDIYDELVSVR